MKLGISVLFALLFSVTAMANDGGMAYIDVKGIAPVKNAQDGTEIKFYGKDAATFMKLLPSYSTVLYGMVQPQVADQLKENQRGVMVVSNGWTLNFNCAAGDVVAQDTEFGSDYASASFVFAQPECTISLHKGNWRDEGDNWSMESRNYEANMCTP